MGKSQEHIGKIPYSSFSGVFGDSDITIFNIITYNFLIYGS